jgi:hypothetical protein
MQAARFKWKFTQTEDMQLTQIVAYYGCDDWTLVASRMPGRNARQCRERWLNYINPQLSRTPLTRDEENLLEAKYLELGPRWQMIASFFPGRAKNFLKNQWRLRHKQKQGSEPERQQSTVEVADKVCDEPAASSAPLTFLDVALREEENHESFWQLFAAGLF